MFTHTTSLLFFAAATQGFFLAIMLGLHRRNAQANHILAVFVAILSVDLLQQIYCHESLYKSYPQFLTLINLLPLTYGGFLFLYVRSLTQGTLLRLRDIYHFAFFILGIIVSWRFLVLASDEKLAFLTQMTVDTTPSSVRIFSLLNPLTATIYGLAAFILLRRHSKTAVQKLAWLQIILGLNLLTWAVVWLTILAPTHLLQPSITVVYLLVSIIIYMLGYFSLRQPAISTTAENTPKSPTAKYGDNRLPDDLRAQIFAEIESHMQKDEGWRQSSLTLAQLATLTGLSVHQISQVLNDHRGQSFNDYLNQYRVEAVCSLLRESQSDNLLDLALSCGFSSKSSFNAIFKKQVQLTPSEYRKQYQATKDVPHPKNGRPDL